MTGRIDSIDQGELWIRCPYCGDSSSDPEKCHFSINLEKWLYHCHRCNAGGKLSTREMVNLITSRHLDISIFSGPPRRIDQSEQTLPELIPGAGSPRKSLLERYHLTLNEHVWDSFYLYEPKDSSEGPVGVHIRNGSRKFTIGKRGWAWPGQALLSSTDDPLLLVEGPYDVISSRMVSKFGLITYKSLKDLVGHVVILVPDGDTWDPRLRLAKQTVELLRDSLYSRPDYPVILGLYKLPENLDPDSGLDHATYYPRSEFLRLGQDLLRKMSDGKTATQISVR